MPTPTQKALLDTLESITGTGVFCATANTPFFPPEMRVVGAGEIGFPLTAAQARELISLAEAAPYGKGIRTVRDDRVRRCWQFDAANVTFDNPDWDKFLKRTVDETAKAMGVTGKVAAEPYKVLLYEKGGHFLPHRDTEKLDAMFGTLIIALPSSHEGGRLRVRHAGQEVVVDFSGKPGRAQFQTAAFFADCEHEVEPVESGVRFCLVYNLRLAKGDPAELNASVGAQAERLAPALRRLTWSDPPKPLAVLLDHQYTEANFSLAGLKGHDSSRARALLSAADASGLIGHLSLVTLHQSGALEGDGDGYGGYGRRSRRWHDDDEEEDDGDADGTMGEIYEEYLQASHWRDCDDKPAPIPALHLPEECLLAAEPLGEGEPDEKESEGFTGNAGCTMEYWYRRAAVILWPRDRHEATLCALSFQAACAWLRKDSKRPGARGTPEYMRLRDAVLTGLSEQVRLPTPSDGQEDPDAVRRKDDPENESPFLMVVDALLNAKDAPGLAALVDDMHEETFAELDSPRCKRLVATFGLKTLEPVLAVLLANPGGPLRTLGFRLLRAAVTQKDEVGVRRLALVLAGLPPRPVGMTYLRSPDPDTPGNISEIVIMLQASACATNRVEAKTLLTFLMGDQSLVYLRFRLAPALFRWFEEGGSPAILKNAGSPAYQAWRFARERLDQELKRKLVAPADWIRPFTPPPAPQPSPFAARANQEETQLRQEMAAFMANPVEKTHVFALRADLRLRIEQWIRDQNLDVDFHTQDGTNPKKLVCTKNLATHNRALKTREADRALAAKLATLT